MNDEPRWTLDAQINEALSDDWIKYRTLRYCGLVRGQLVDVVAEEMCAALNHMNVQGFKP
jgi:hypothetical protein